MSFLFGYNKPKDEQNYYKEQLDEQKLFNSETKDEEFPPKVKLVTDAIKTTTTDQSLQKVEIEKSLFVRFFDWIKKL